MYYPAVIENENNRSMISNWLGYNHNYRIGDGELYDMENLTSDGYPLMMPRNTRPLLIESSLRQDSTEEKPLKREFMGMLYTDNTLCYLDGYEFHFSTWSINLTKLVTGEEIRITTENDDTDVELTEYKEQTLIRFGSYVLIYPLNIWVNVISQSNVYEAGTMAARMQAEGGETITYSLSDAEGNVDIYSNATVADEAPEEPEVGDYWLCTSLGSEGLNIYYASGWTPVATTYIKIQVPNVDFTEYFEQYDVVSMNSTKVKDINDGSQIEAIGTDYIVVVGLIKELVIEEKTLKVRPFVVERKIPVLDYVCSDKNRVWGCRYGYDDSTKKFVNEIYCTKLGDFKNWYVYQGLTTDSYAVSVGVPGEWTGCISYGGYPTFFKENAIFRIYGSYPAEYMIIQTDARGVQNGSHKSLAIIGDNLFYKAPDAVVVFDGSLPVPISNAFGRDAYYYDGTAGVFKNKYYIEMTNSYMGHLLFVYDTQYGIWTKESPISAIGFSWGLDGQLYVASKTQIFGLGNTDNYLYQKRLIGEEYVEWFAETGDMGYEYPDFKYVSRLTLRAYIPYQSELKVEISYDDRPFDDVKTLRGMADVATQSLAIPFPLRCDHYKLRFSGHGAVRIYSLAITLETESEENGFTH